jgi:hypothetical protein
MILNNSYFDNDNYNKDEYDHNNISLNSDKRNNDIEGEYFDYNIGNNGQFKEEDIKKLFVSYKDNKSMQTDLDEKSKNNIIFKIDKERFYEEDINMIIQKMNISKENKRSIFLNNEDNYEEINNIRYKLFLKGKFRMKKQRNYSMFKIYAKKGRKLKMDNSNRTHNKYQPDNIIQSIKTTINHSLLFFLNKLINSIYDKTKINQILYQLNLPLIKKDRKLKLFKLIKENDYDININNTSKSYNLKFLNFTINNYISNNISRKFKKKPPNYNKLIIKKLLEDEQNNDIFNFIFNYLKIEDWLDIFIYKKEIDNYFNNNQLNQIKINKIKENLIRIDDLLLKMYKDNKLYFHCFTLMIYNFKKYFLSKEGRILKSKQNE